MVEEQDDGSSHWGSPNLQNIILNRSIIHTNNGLDGTTRIPKDKKEWNVKDKIAIQNKTKAKKILICEIGPNEYNRNFACRDAKVI